jgi:hypothetical protein
MSTVPGTAFQWFDPFGKFFDDILTDKFGNYGKIASAAILPGTGLKNIGNWLGGLF